MESNINLQLGDIIELEASSNQELHKKIFFIKYISSEKIILVNSDKDFTLNIKPTGELYEESIESINILSRAETPSYAEQNKYFPGTWISIFFRGTFPIIINGVITNIESDMIELKTYPNNDIIYIDFEYKGLPEDLNIEKIKIIDEKDILNQGIEQTDPSKETSPTDSLLEDDENNYKEDLKELILDADAIEIGESLEAIKQEIKVDEDQFRYSINKQLDDLLDDILSNIPNSNRNETTMNNINLEIERFRQLREKYSNFDNITTVKDIKYFYQKSPLSDNLKNLDYNLQWLIPIVTNIKRIYDTESEDNNYIQENNMLDLLTKVYNLNDKWKSNQIGNDENKYKLYIKQIFDIFEPYLPIDDDDSIIYNNVVNNNIDVIVDNTDLIENYGINKNELSVKKYDTIKLNTSIKMLKTDYDMNTSSRYQIDIKNSDTLALKSLLMLPENYIEYSKIHLPYTSILEKSELNHDRKFNYKLLKKNRFVNSYLINNKDEVDKNIHSDGLNINQLSHLVPEYYNDETLDRDKLFDNFLNICIPSKKVILDDIKTRRDNIYNIKSIIDATQSYLFSYDNINIDDFNNINSIINVNIRSYISTIKKYQTKISRERQVSMDVNENILINIIKEEYRNVILEYYKIIKTNYTSSELLSLIQSKDDGNMYINLLNNSITEIIISDLVSKIEKQIDKKKETPSELDSISSDETSKEVESIKDSEPSESIKEISSKSKKVVIQEETPEETPEEPDKETKTGGANDDEAEVTEPDDKEEDVDKVIDDKNVKCNKYVFSKKYIEIDELQEDNDKPIYFDKQYDKTPYSIIDEYREERDSMSADDFYDFLYKNLKKNIGLDTQNAKRDAKAMIEGKKLINDGDYAMLESTGEIFVRKSNKWVVDKTLSMDKFLETNKIFCNMQKNCIEVKDKCLDLKSARKSFEDDNISKMLSTFDSKYENSIEQIRKKLLTSLEKNKTYLEKILKINQKEKMQYDQIFYNIGLQLTSTDFILSPYEDLKNKILEIKDLPKRQLYIIKFCKFFTRTYLESEDKNWLYCIKTGIKLIPSFLVRLAEVFINKGDYVTEVDTICAERGTISDDGNNWVDKYSGYIIKNIEFNNDEGFDEQGYRLQSREILEKDYTINVGEKDEKADIKSVNGKILSIINAISGFIGVDISSYNEFIVRNVVEINKKNLPSQENYEKLLKKSTDKKMMSYDDALNINIIIITLVFILISIQSSMPSVKTKKVFPGCIKSFSGYPLESNTDKSGIVYIACITNKIKSNIEPWKSIVKMNEKTIVKKMETIIEKYIINNKEVKRLFKSKLDYLLINPDDIVDKSILITNWTTFLPPLGLFQIEASKILPIEKIDSFIKTNITRQKSDMVKNILLSKIKFLTLDIVSKIENVVNKNKPILSNNSGEPFLENSCCDSEINNTIEYFIENDKTILQNLNIISVYSEEFKRLNKLATAATVYYPLSTKRLREEIPKTYSEKTIYNGFIYYCKYYNGTDELINSLCGDKPKDIDFSKDIDEIIEIYKREGKNYSLYDFENLLLQISKKNIISLTTSNEMINSMNILYKLLQLEQYKELFDERFIELMNSMLDTYDLEGSKDSNREYKNYISREIKNFKLAINVFLNKNSKLSKRDNEKINGFFDSLIALDSELKDDVNINYWCKYIKNIINDIIVVFPKIVINQLDTRNIEDIKHWELSNVHNKDIAYFISEYYEKLVKFYDNDNLDKLLNYVSRKFAPLKIFINHINYNSNKYQPDKEMIFDKTVVLNTLIYLLLMILYNYLHVIDDDLIKYEIFGDEEIDIDSDLNKSIKILISDFIVNVLDMNNNNIKLIDYNNKKIVDKITKSKEIEKGVITDGLRDMNDEEREIANIFKNNKLGDWNIGLQKGLTQYVKENYDKERERLEQQAIQDKKMGDKGIVTEMNKEIFKLQQQYDEMIEEEIDRENYDMGMIPDDGDFDPDDIGGVDDEYANY